MFVPEHKTNYTLQLEQSETPENVSTNSHRTVPDGFLVWNPGCQMPKMDPLAKDVMEYFHRGNNNSMKSNNTCFSTYNDPSPYVCHRRIAEPRTIHPKIGSCLKN